jgi:pimeloyl-ACP methyl ester carboxylesterase
VNTPQSKIPYRVAGDSNAQPIVLLHGAGVSRILWHPQINALSEHFQIFAPDLPRHGSLKDMPFSLRDSVQIVADLIQKEGLNSAIIVGISTGGYIAMAHARRYPNQSIGLVLSGSSMNLTGLNGISYLGAALLQKFKNVDWIEGNSRKSMHKISPEEAMLGVLDGGLYDHYTNKIFSQLALRNYARMIRNYPHPILFINGSDDEPNCKGIEKMLAALPTAKVEIIENAGHLVNLEQPEAFNSAIVEFARNGARP